jgi:hypothetical protein
MIGFSIFKWRETGVSFTGAALGARQHQVNNRADGGDSDGLGRLGSGRGLRRGCAPLLLLLLRLRLQLWRRRQLLLRRRLRLLRLLLGTGGRRSHPLPARCFPLVGR